MVISNLDKIFNSKSIAVIGVSDEEDSEGYILMKNLTELDYQGKVYPVNGVMLPDNYRARNLMKKMGFCIKYEEGVVKAILNLKEEELGIQPEIQETVKEEVQVEKEEEKKPEVIEE